MDGGIGLKPHPPQGAQRPTGSACSRAPSGVLAQPPELEVSLCEAAVPRMVCLPQDSVLPVCLHDSRVFEL